ncbi:MAG TPA: methylated-DNA--[protein]-cysteine S-methyltransferase [Burkholderiaceae bacterium]|nr:methylated-DNA--[protein]-cysteine S-methyltransferase [Burkholderiaceae bacterium]
MNPRSMASLAAQARMPTPLGPVTLAATARGLAGLWFDGQKYHPGPLAAPVDPGHPHIAQAMDELGRYFAGASASAFTTRLDPQGTPFQQEVWRALLRIASGSTRTYGELAAGLQVPGAARAVGAAVGRNPISILVPCHRVLGSGGSLTGYAGGLHRKQALLGLEARCAGVLQ